MTDRLRETGTQIMTAGAGLGAPAAGYADVIEPWLSVIVLSLTAAWLLTQLYFKWKTETEKKEDAPCD